MIDWVAAWIVDEGKWLTVSMTLAMTAVGILALRTREPAMPLRRRILAAMNLSAGVTVGTMAVGHLLAVSVKLAMGTLREGSLLIFFGIGISLLVPAWMVARHTRTVLAGTHEPRPTTALLNGWLAATLLAMGVHNLPLAAPALFTIAYRVFPGGLTGWAIVGIAVVVQAGLFAASLVFLASGQSFEQFRGIE
jgi:hypothetical protein